MPTLRVERDQSLLTVTLARPEVRNAFDDVVIAELTEVLRGAARDPALRVLVLAADGPVFSAGADLSWMRRAAEASRDENLKDARAMATMFRALSEVPVPVIAKVHGTALGGGTGLVACADIALAAPGAKFGFTEVRLGIVPAVISTFVLRKIGRAAALRYFVTGEIFDAARAAEIGLVSEVVPREDLDAKTAELVRQIRSVGPNAARRAKRLVDEVLASPYPRILDEAAELIADLRATEEAKEGMLAFLGKRTPSWAEGTP